MLHHKSSFDIYLFVKLKGLWKYQRQSCSWSEHCMGYAGFTLCWTGMNCTFIPYIFDKYTLSMIFIGSPDGERSDTTTSCCKRTNQYAVGNRRVSPTSRFPFHLYWLWHLKKRTCCVRLLSVDVCWDKLLMTSKYYHLSF